MLYCSVFRSVLVSLYCQTKLSLNCRSSSLLRNMWGKNLILLVGCLHSYFNSKSTDWAYTELAKINANRINSSCISFHFSDFKVSGVARIIEWSDGATFNYDCTLLDYMWQINLTDWIMLTEVTAWSDVLCVIHWQLHFGTLCFEVCGCNNEVDGDIKTATHQRKMHTPSCGLSLHAHTHKHTQFLSF